ncbi:DnaJ domain-containing protein [Candidatus Poseidoniaceae archaeon]|nr:J domain-containing protein [Candidatus Poseidoniaceae archaeon]MDA9166207.1 DnaJ domain-containing protein [Candidatus Poseidoniaceae archaeon]MDA9828822.1 DnaJ domain-containing protein [Candidatus Poseidoniaceae archaeon]
MAKQDPYSVLGVGRNASDVEIKRAFRKKARQFHPDRNQGDASAEAKFKEVQAAYESIATAKDRNEYEQQQRMSSMFGGGGGGNPFGGGGGGMEDILGQMFGGGGRPRGGNPFGGMGGQPQQRQQRPKGADISVSLELTAEQAEQGGQFPFTFKRLKPNAAGTMEPTSVTLRTRVKPGVKHGTTSRLKGQGHDHPEGAAGDVMLTIRIHFGEGRFWDGKMLVQEVPTPFSTLMLGGKVKVQLPSNKKIMLTVSPETMVGDRLRIAGAGYDGGDLELEFVLPDYDELSKEQVKALENLKNSGL